MAKETIKSRVIQTVQGDPFLSIDEIAQKVATTPRYVRTILSEAGLSLLQLRKDYAKSMEKQLGPKKLSTQIKQVDPDLKFTQITDAVIAKILNQPSSTKLMQISRKERLNQIQIYKELITYLEIKLTSVDGPLTDFLLFDRGLRLEQGHSWIEVHANQPSLSNLLDSLENQPLMKISTVLLIQKKPIALKIRWLPTKGILLRTNTGNFEIAAEF